MLLLHRSQWKNKSPNRLKEVLAEKPLHRLIIPKILYTRVSQPGVLEPQGYAKVAGGMQKVPGSANYDIGGMLMVWYGFVSI